MPIRVLSTLMINQIAAGEVIERPASVVKELVDNSLDAGASRIHIEITDGGRELIRVSDDGTGIPPDELALALTQHATSKIAEPGDLAAIGTLGFRGEALASIASVSRFKAVSRTGLTEEAWSLSAAGETMGDITPTSGRPGTSMEARDLFFNVPARRKFLRAAGTESVQVADAVERIAMVNPHVGFTLVSNGRTALELPPSQSRKARAMAVMGTGVEDGLFEFELAMPGEPGAPKVWGLAGHPSLAKVTGKGVFLAVNGRPVRDRNLQHAVREAYRGLMPPDKFPLAAVFLELDPREVDVNVHPQKTEVRFRSPGPLHSLIHAAIARRLQEEEIVASAALPSARPSFAEASKVAAPTSHEFVDHFKRMDTSQKSLVFDEVRRALEKEDPQSIHPVLAPSAPVPQPGWASAGEVREPVPAPAASAPSAAPSLVAVPILHFRSAYIVTQDEQGLLIVDQHALHERVMFEEFRQRILVEGKPLESQGFLLPEVIPASASSQEVLEDLRPLLDRIGIDAAPFGPKQIAIHAFPSLLVARGVAAGPFLAELLDQAADGHLRATSDTAMEQALHEVLDMMSCKAAIKAGNHLSMQEMAALLRRREEIERSSNCPHGRPTTLRLTLRDLEKQFGRS